MFTLIKKRETMSDDAGKVQILIRLMDPAKPSFPKKGNRSRSITVETAKVSEVYEYIVAAMCAVGASK